MGDTGEDTRTPPDPILDVAVTGFVATARFTKDVTSTEACDLTMDILGTASGTPRTMCDTCDWAFTMTAVTTYATGDRDCLPDMFAVMSADNEHFDAVLGYDVYNVDDYEGPSVITTQHWYLYWCTATSPATSPPTQAASSCRNPQTTWTIRLR